MAFYTRKNNEPVIMYPLNDPFTIDKSKAWKGDHVQNFPNGGYIQLTKDGIVSHGVQKSKYGDFPTGWKQVSNNPHVFEKNDVWAIINDKDLVIEYDSLDGPMSVPNPNLDHYQVFNLNPDGLVDVEDGWVVPKTKFEELYQLR